MLSRRLILLLMLLFLVSDPAWAQAPSAEPSPPETQASVSSGSAGEILFSVAGQGRPEGGRYRVGPGASVKVCLRLGQDLPLLKNLRKNLVGFRLILEDNAIPPHRLVATVGNRLRRLAEDPDGCYPGELVVPPRLPAALYQVADLLLFTDQQNYASIRESLYGFTQADELQVENPAADGDPPALKRVSRPGSRLKKEKVSPRMLRARLNQTFEFEDASRLDRRSLRVYYALSVEGSRQDTLAARCRAKGRSRFVCRVEVKGMREDLSLPKVSLSLEKITIEDELGNRLTVDRSEDIAEKAEENKIDFEFPSLEKDGDYPRYDLGRDR